MPTNTSPQSVSTRYAHNLLARGSNKIFELDVVDQRIATTPSGLPMGFYFMAKVKRTVDFSSTEGEGLTPLAAVANALVAHGVTFR